MVDDQPVLAALVDLISGWGLVAGAVHEAEQLPVELRQAAGVGGIQDHLEKGRVGAGVFHTRIVARWPLRTRVLEHVWMGLGSMPGAGATADSQGRPARRGPRYGPVAPWTLTVKLAAVAPSMGV